MAKLADPAVLAEAIPDLKRHGSQLEIFSELVHRISVRRRILRIDPDIAEIIRAEVIRLFFAFRIRTFDVRGKHAGLIDGSDEPDVVVIRG